MSDNVKYQVLTRLANLEEPDQIAAELDISTTKVLRIKRELESAQTNGNLMELMDVPEENLRELASEIKLNAPNGLQEATGEVLNGVIDKVKGAAALQEELQTTGLMINRRVRALANGTQSVGDLSTLTEILCMLQNAFFNKNQTQVNVQNNYERPYGNFLSDKPADH